MLSFRSTYCESMTNVLLFISSNKSYLNLIMSIEWAFEQCAIIRETYTVTKLRKTKHILTNTIFNCIPVSLIRRMQAHTCNKMHDPI